MPLKVNTSKDRKPFESLPVGWYWVQIADVELKESKSDRSKDKEGWPRMYGFEFVVTDDPRNPQDEDGASKFKGRHLWSNACLWEGATFTIEDILFAIGRKDLVDSGDVPDVTDPAEREELVGKFLKVRYSVTKKKRLEAQANNEEPDPEITRYARYDDEDVSAAAPAATTRRRVLA